MHDTYDTGGNTLHANPTKWKTIAPVEPGLDTRKYIHCLSIFTIFKYKKKLSEYKRKLSKYEKKYTARWLAGDEENSNQA